MNNEKTRPSEGRDVFKTILISTLVFILLLGVLGLLYRALPGIRLRAAESALSAGNFERTRELAEKLDDGESARELLRACDYQQGKTRMEQGDWEEAAKLFSAATGYADAAELKTECGYQLACARMDAGDWDEAIRLFGGLAAYLDSREKADACRYGKALALAENGELTEAAALFADLGDYADARSRRDALATEITGLDDVQAAVAALQGLSGEDLLRLSELTARREILPAGIIDVGFYHTVGLTADGRVYACGSDGYGQCQVAGWTNVTAVVAGAYHTLALHADGTVSAAGRGSEGQCEVSAWRDVIAIAAADYASFGLCADGTLLCSGYNDYTRPAQWIGLSAVYGGSYNVGALGRDGSARIYPDLTGSEELTGLVSLTLNTGYAVGLKADGTAVATAFDLSGWQDVVAVSCSGTIVLGLTSDGRVLSHAFRSGDALDFSTVTDAVAIAAGGTHCAVVHSDGSVQVFGRDAEGQAQTESWKLF